MTWTCGNSIGLNAHRIEICAKLRVREPTSSYESLLPTSTLGKEDRVDHDILQRRAADWFRQQPLHSASCSTRSCRI